LFEKIGSAQLVRETDDGESLLDVDRHLLYEITSPQAYSMPRASTDCLQDWLFSSP
jgi:3-isopropylmalate/(R)-2-methylmalate dehydratase large subunit